MKVKTLVRNSLFLLFCLVAVAAGFPASAATVVEVPGNALGPLLGLPVAQLRLYASDRGVAKAIPFQIDEKSPAGAWLLDSEAAGVLDPQDILLFHLDDAGPAAGPGLLPQARAKVEIEAAGKFVYLAAEEAPGPKAGKSYVRYIPGQDRVSTAFYDIAFNPRQPLVQDTLILHNGGSQADLLDRFKVRFVLAIKNFFDFKINESDVEARMVGTKVGPIRVIRRVSATKKLGPINLVPKSVSDFLFYPNWVEVPTRIKNPIDGPKFLSRKTQGLSGYDFTKAIYGATLYSSLGGAAANLDGASGPAEAAMSSGPATWWALNGSMGSLVVGIQNDPKLESLGLGPVLRVTDEAGQAAPPESEAGECLIGFDLPYHKIPKGSYLIQVKQVFPWRFRHGQEEAYLQDAKTLRVEASKAL